MFPSVTNRHALFLCSSSSSGSATPPLIIKIKERKTSTALKRNLSTQISLVASIIVITLAKR